MKLLAGSADLRRNASRVALGVLWLGLSCGGLVLLAWYGGSPGTSRAAPPQWPVDSSIHLSEQGATLIVFAHPHCPCTRANLGELEKIVARSGSTLDALTLCDDPRQSGGGAVFRPLTILLAEDNDVNQRVARGILEKRGHTVVIANNGQEATLAVATQRFDLVLMDVQMPVMDGIEATGIIRRSEATRGVHTPIVAMTAHAMKGDREHCLEAGMDDYLSKPIQVQELLATIERYASPQRGVRETMELPQTRNNSLPERSSAASATSAFSRTVADGGEPIDLTTFLTRVENDWDLLHEMIDLFLDSSPRLLAEIEGGMVRRDSRTVERATHTLKGAMQSISALPAARAAANLEAIARKPEPYTYILLLTGKRAQYDIIAGLDAGADDYVTKPFDPAELKVRLRTGKRILYLQEQLIDAREALRDQATHDRLTGLWNRAAIVDLLNNELARAHRQNAPVAVVMADLDFFKRINDTYGHPTGDEVLRNVSNAMRDSVRRYDSVGRYGGEEFLIVLPGCDQSNALGHAERIRAAIARIAVEKPTGIVRPTMSLGGRCFRELHRTGRLRLDERRRHCSVSCQACRPQPRRIRRGDRTGRDLNRPATTHKPHRMRRDLVRAPASPCALVHGWLGPCFSSRRSEKGCRNRIKGTSRIFRHNKDLADRQFFVQ